MRWLAIAVVALSCTAPQITTGSPSPSPTLTPPPSSTALASPSRSPSPAFRDLKLIPAGDVRGDHALVHSVLTSPTGGVPSVNHIWDVPLDGGPPRQLVAYTRGSQLFTDYDRLDLSRQLSADGRQMVLSDPADIAGSGLIVVDLIAGTARKIAIDGGSDQPAWSPDGRYIAYRGFTIAGVFQKETGIWVVPTSGGAPQQVTTSDIAAGAGASSVYGWTEDGTAIAYSRGSADANVVEFATGKITRIGRALLGIAWRATRPSVALIFDEQERTPNAALVGHVEVRDTTLSAPTTIARYGPSEGTFLVAPKWNPSVNELMVLYACGQGVACRTEIVVIDSARAERRMPTKTTPRSAAWSADGARILYGDLDALRLMNADGSNDRELFRPAQPPNAVLEFVTGVTALAPR
jgi:WD40-like Beta Propeller Repeat